MSSHHIVKDKQEPALYIAEFNNFDEEFLGQLLEWSPTVIVAASAYEKVFSLGLKVDIIVGEVAEGLALQENTKTIPLVTNGIADALSYLIQEKYPAVNIISSVSTFDDLTCYLPDINIVLFTDTTKHYPIKNGFSVWKPAGTKLLVDVVAYFEATNLAQVNEREFDVVEDGLVSFSFQSAYLFLGEYLY